MTKLYDICKPIKTVDLTLVQSSARRDSIVSGLKPAQVDPRQGLRHLTPAQLLSLEVPTLTREGDEFAGFQRPLDVNRARRIARALLRGIELPPIQVSTIAGNGRLLLTDGQHRAVAAVMVRQQLESVVIPRTYEAAKELFANQGKGAKVNPNVLVLAGSSPFDEYVQDAVTCDGHIWSGIVGEGATRQRISPKQMSNMIQKYCMNSLGQRGEGARPEEFDQQLADELGLLVAAFGTKATNPAAFQPKSLTAITDAAVLIIRRRPEPVGLHRLDVERWRRWMPRFDFSSVAYLRSKELTDALVGHWNKRLASDRRVTR